ncbi:MAG: hypothetical protein EOO61_04675 [Hymenobacter sp.]|nr:MAG: hypothetical protein EOO61_04675 [Hymenobacter sp.]
MANPSTGYTLSDELMAELLTAFATSQHWTDLTNHQVATEIIRQCLTVRFHAFIQTQLSY